MRDRLTPSEALGRFGELTWRVGSRFVYREFEMLEGIWKPEFEDGIKLRGYRLHPSVKVPHVRAPYRPK